MSMRVLLVAAPLTGFVLQACLGSTPAPCAANTPANAVITPAEPCITLSTTSCQGVPDSVQITNGCSDPLTLDLVPDEDGAGDEGHETVATGATVSVFGRDVPDGELTDGGAPIRATIAATLGATALTVAFDVPE